MKRWAKRVKFQHGENTVKTGEQYDENYGEQSIQFEHVD